MAKALNFNKIKKNYFTVTLPDENESTLMICTPTKAIMDEFISMKDSLSAENMGDDAIDQLYELCAKIMNRNKGGIKIAKKELEEMFDFEDIIIFIRSYTEFINELSNSKN
jgi:hypothetical protein